MSLPGSLRWFTATPRRSSGAHRFTRATGAWSLRRVSRASAATAAAATATTIAAVLLLASLSREGVIGGGEHLLDGRRGGVRVGAPSWFSAARSLSKGKAPPRRPGEPTDWLTASKARLSAAEPPPAEVYGQCVPPEGEEEGKRGGVLARLGLADALGGGCCTLRLPPRGGDGSGEGESGDGGGGRGGRGGGADGGSSGNGDGGGWWHDSLATTPDAAEVARRRTVHSPPDGDTLFSVVDAYKERLYTPAGGGHGVPRADWPAPWARRWAVSAALATDAVGVMLAADNEAATALARAGKGKGWGGGKVALSAAALPITHYRLDSMAGEVWAFDMDASAVAMASPPDGSPTSAATTAAEVAAAKAAAARAAASTPPPTPVAFKAVVTRPLGSVGGCSVRVFPRPPAAPLTLILPYAGRPTALATYLTAYGRLRRRDPAVSLIIATLSQEVGAVRKVVAAASLPALPPPAGADGGDGGSGERSDGVVVLATKGDKFGNFSRSVALREAVRLLPLPALFFVTDVDLDIKAGAVRNCRANALAGAQVWYPIFFSLYAGVGPGLTRRSGYWRTSSYGTVCAHRLDWEAVGGFGGGEEWRYTGWGGEDVDLYNRFRDAPTVAVARGVEPNLVHAWHAKACVGAAEPVACAKTVAMSMASQERLAELVVEGGVNVAAALGVTPEKGGGMG